MNIIPLKFMLKFDPPQIALAYKNSIKEKKIRLYQIYLHGVINRGNPKEIAEQLISEHQLYLNPTIVSFNQIKRLCEQLLMSYRNKQQSLRISHPSPSKPEKTNAHPGSPTRRGMNDEDIRTIKRMAQRDKTFSPPDYRPQSGGSPTMTNSWSFNQNNTSNSEHNDSKKIFSPIKTVVGMQDVQELEGLESKTSYVPSALEQNPQQPKRVGRGPMGLLKDLSQKNRAQNPPPQQNNMDYILNDIENLELIE